MPLQITAKELRTKTRQALDAVGRGEEVIVSYRGKPSARLVPLEALARRPDGQATSPLFGLWADRQDVSDAVALVREMRRPRHE